VTILEGTGLAGYGVFLGVAFGRQTVIATRRLGESAWRKPVSRADAVGETLCGLGCLVTLASPALALAGVVEPLDVGREGPRLVATVGGMAAATGLAVWAQRHLASEWRAGIEPSRHLVTTGPFARVRNPFYVACLAASAAVVVAVPSVVSLGGLALHVLAAEVIVRVVEEPLLERAHGAAFEAYRRRTGRFLPTPRRTPRWELRPSRRPASP
jgi:protein-S-isoprenylcysteine O-methyltransferase Ste14